MDLAICDLNSIIDKKAYMTFFVDSDIMKVLEQSIDALSHLKKFKINHKNIKPSNILISEEKDLKIMLSDFKLEKANQQNESDDA